MTPLRWLIVGFWLFVGSMLFWQAYSYNQALDQQIVAHPEEQHLFYQDPHQKKQAAATLDPNVHVADVHQVAYSVQVNVPSTGMGTAHVTIKNRGNAKAISVQVYVRPYRESYLVNSDYGEASRHGPLSDEDPLSLMGQWVSFPDIEPGQTANGTAIFLLNTKFVPGTNPKPNIIFATEGATP